MPPRRPKRLIPPDVYPSPVSVEYVSFAREDNGRVTKKRVVEKTKFETRPLLDIDALFPAHPDPSFADVDGSSEPTGDASFDPKGDPARRAVSVSTIFPCHVTIGLRVVDQACRMAALPPTVPL